MKWLALTAYLFLSTCAYTPALAQHNHPPQDAKLHEEFYSKWLRPGMRLQDGRRYSSCCNKQDCRPTPIKRVDGYWYALRGEDGAWVKIENGILEEETPDPLTSPDLQSHACISAANPYSDGQVYCAVRGSGQ